MAWIIAIATKAAWWVLPKVLGTFVNYTESVLRAVELADTAPIPADRRDRVLANLAAEYPLVPETINRAAVEVCVILRGLGITTNQLDQMEKLVRDEATYDHLSSDDKRAYVMERFGKLFPDVPERAARLLLEIAVAKLRGQ